MDGTAEKLLKARLAAGMSLRAAERASGVDKTTISLLERGRQEAHNLTLSKLAAAYKVEIDDLREFPKERARRVLPYDPDKIESQVRERADFTNQREFNQALHEATMDALSHLSVEELIELQEEIEQARADFNRPKTKEEHRTKWGSQAGWALIEMLEASSAVQAQLSKVAPREHA